MEAAIEKGLKVADLEEYTGPVLGNISTDAQGTACIAGDARVFLDALHENDAAKLLQTLKDLGVRILPRKAANPSITVCVRKKRAGKSGDILKIEGSVLTLEDTKLSYDLARIRSHHSFSLDHLFGGDASNREIFEAVIRRKVSHAMHGGCSSFIAYGQTGTGKTHTMLHLRTGVVFEAIRHILDCNMQGHISLCENYMGRVYDCLNGRSEIQMYESRGEVYLSESTQKAFRSHADAEKIIADGLCNRTVRRTGGNEHSSRSHAVIFVEMAFSGCVDRVLQNKRIPSQHSMIFVDLAGSERAADRGESTSVSASESAEINKSLLVLKECIRGLELNSRFLPFRQSKLTQILKNALLGGSETCIIATVSSEAKDAEHTLNTLRYASRIREHLPLYRLGACSILSPIDVGPGPEEKGGVGRVAEGLKTGDSKVLAVCGGTVSKKHGAASEPGGWDSTPRDGQAPDAVKPFETGGAGGSGGGRAGPEIPGAMGYPQTNGNKDGEASGGTQNDRKYTTTSGRRGLVGQASDIEMKSFCGGLPLDGTLKYETATSTLVSCDGRAGMNGKNGHSVAEAPGSSLNDVPSCIIFDDEETFLIAGSLADRNSGGALDWRSGTQLSTSAGSDAFAHNGSFNNDEWECFRSDTSHLAVAESGGGATDGPAEPAAVHPEIPPSRIQASKILELMEDCSAGIKNEGELGKLEQIYVKCLEIRKILDG